MDAPAAPIIPIRPRCRWPRCARLAEVSVVSEDGEEILDGGLCWPHGEATVADLNRETPWRPWTLVEFDRRDHRAGPG